MAVEILLIVVGTLISVVMQYIHSLAGFDHHVPCWLLTLTRVRVHADTATGYTNNNDTNTDNRQQPSPTIKVSLTQGELTFRCRVEFGDTLPHTGCTRVQTGRMLVTFTAHPCHTRRKTQT
jgi:hypothetical protein